MDEYQKLLPIPLLSSDHILDLPVLISQHVEVTLAERIALLNRQIYFYDHVSTTTPAAATTTAATGTATGMSSMRNLGNAKVPSMRFNMPTGQGMSDTNMKLEAMSSGSVVDDEEEEEGV